MRNAKSEMESIVLKSSDNEEVVMYSFENEIDYANEYFRNVYENPILFRGFVEELRGKPESFWEDKVRTKGPTMYHDYTIGRYSLIINFDARHSGLSAIEHLGGNYFLIIKHKTL